MTWRQLDVDLGPRSARARAAAEVFTRLRAVFDDARAGTWFVRKPPGLRIRVRRGSTGDQLDDLLRGLRADGVVARVGESVYEPEMRRFGGEEPMELVHRFFHADSRGFFAWHARRERARLDVALFSIGVVGTLFSRLLHGSSSEIWDAWANLAALHAIGCRCDQATPLPIVDIDRLWAVAGAGDAELLADYDAACRALASDLDAVQGRGDFGVGRRAFGADVALFHWNRFGLPTNDRHTLLTGTLAALDPHRSLPCP